MTEHTPFLTVFPGCAARRDSCGGLDKAYITDVQVNLAERRVTVSAWFPAMPSPVEEEALCACLRDDYALNSVRLIPDYPQYIDNFLKINPDGVIVELGCGLETTYFRHPNIKSSFYDLDLPEVIDYREKMIPLGEHQKLIKGDLFKKDWIEKIKSEIGNKPVLIVVGGVFHYFPRENVISAIKNMLNFDKIELVFDALNSLGIKGIKKYMNDLGHSDTAMYFYVNDVNEFAKEIGPEVKVLEEIKYYSQTPKDGLDFWTKVQMSGADLFYMVKMIHLKLK